MNVAWPRIAREKVSRCSESSASVSDYRKTDE